MKLDEITYMCWELIRNNKLTDDDNLDLRLLEAFVQLKRVEYIKKANRKSTKYISDNLKQEFLCAFEIVELGQYNILRSSIQVPRVVNLDYSNILIEVCSADMIAIPTTVVGNNQFRYSGNGKFNKDIIYTTLRNDYLFLNSKNKSIVNNIENMYVRLVAENPLAVPGFNKATMEYPIDLDGIEYIKDSLFTKEFKLFQTMNYDKVNDGSGDMQILQQTQQLQ